MCSVAQYRFSVHYLSLTQITYFSSKVLEISQQTECPRIQCVKDPKFQELCGLNTDTTNSHLFPSNVLNVCGEQGGCWATERNRQNNKKYCGEETD